MFADFTPLPELGELQQVVYLGDGKKHLTWDYLKALTPLALAIWYMDDGGFTLRSKGLQERTAGGSGRVEICVEAMSPGSRERLVELPPRHVRPGRARSRARGARQTGGAAVHHGRDGRRSTSSSRRTFTRRWTTSCCPRFRGQFAVEPEFVEPS